MRFLVSLAVALTASSCFVPPSCLSRQRGAAPARNGHLVTVTVFAEPVAEPLKRRYAAGVGMWERFERGESITIDARGGMTVATLSSWPDRCLRISREDLADLSRAWQPIVERLVRPRTDIQVMTHPFTGDDWRAYSTLVSLSFGSPSDKTFGLLWDGQLSLPEELDTALMATLEAVCSNSRLAKKYLLRDLPSQVAGRLACSPG